MEKCNTIIELGEKKKLGKCGIDKHLRFIREGRKHRALKG
jgi:hypothetical protein